MVCASALAGCSGGVTTPAATDPSAKKDEAAGSDDTPDKPASLSGSYLADRMACAVPKLKAGDKYVQACCILQDKKKAKLKVKNLPDDTFRVATPTNKKLPTVKIEALNLTKYDDQLCHVIYRSPLAGGAAAGSLKLADTPTSTAKGVVTGFLASIPLFKRGQKPSAAPASAAKAPATSAAKTQVTPPKTTGSAGIVGKVLNGLGLADPPKPPVGAATFEVLNTAAKKSSPAFVQAAGAGVAAAAAVPNPVFLPAQIAKGQRGDSPYVMTSQTAASEGVVLSTASESPEPTGTVTPGDGVATQNPSDSVEANPFSESQSGEQVVFSEAVFTNAEPEVTNPDVNDVIDAGFTTEGQGIEFGDPELSPQTPMGIESFGGSPADATGTMSPGEGTLGEPF